MADGVVGDRALDAGALRPARGKDFVGSGEPPATDLDGAALADGMYGGWSATITWP